MNGLVHLFSSSMQYNQLNPIIFSLFAIYLTSGLICLLLISRQIYALFLHESAVHFRTFYLTHAFTFTYGTIQHLVKNSSGFAHMTTLILCGFYCYSCRWCIEIMCHCSKSQRTSKQGQAAAETLFFVVFVPFNMMNEKVNHMHKQNDSFECQPNRKLCKQMTVE